MRRTEKTILIKVYRKELELEAIVVYLRSCRDLEMDPRKGMGDMGTS